MAAAGIKVGLKDSGIHAVRVHFQIQSPMSIQAEVQDPPSILLPTLLLVCSACSIQSGQTLGAVTILEP